MFMFICSAPVAQLVERRTSTVRFTRTYSESVRVRAPVRTLQLAPDWDGVRSVAGAVLMPDDVSERGGLCPVFRAR